MFVNGEDCALTTADKTAGKLTSEIKIKETVLDFILYFSSPFLKTVIHDFHLKGTIK
jgi:hypothetical protein